MKLALKDRMITEKNLTKEKEKILEVLRKSDKIVEERSRRLKTIILIVLSELDISK